jgi:hypothetical protein
MAFVVARWDNSTRGFQVVFALVLIELAGCLLLAGNFALSENGDIAGATLAVWLALAAARLTVHYLPRGGVMRYGVIFLLVLVWVASVMPAKIEALPYFHQVLFVVGVPLLPQLWWESDIERIKGRKNKVLGLTGLLASLPLGYFAWSIANIGIVKAGAWAVTNDVPYCIVVGEGGPVHGGYFPAQDGWSLSGWRMTTGRKWWRIDGLLLAFSRNTRDSG